MARNLRKAWDPDFAAKSAWLWPLGRAAAHLRSRHGFPSLEELDALYAELAGPPALRFVPMQKLRRRSGPLDPNARYDGRIALRHEVPTRDGDWHDLLNALCFATFPKSKRALHARQHRALLARLPPGATRVPATRTREQDALTLFDEGGLVLAAEAQAAEEIARAADAELARVLGALMLSQRLRLIPFGHALFEHLVVAQPCPGASAVILTLPTLALDTGALLGEVDERLACVLEDPTRFRQPREARHVRIADLAAA